eukprot:TRINITY_DN1452_c0_g4_i1.p2 TRINITY_DN1452_c0_g4~~TRINITY_DN1452_c0_g4_i1.p2  ORF type:complete len:148 (+),score=52.72 TRINITY_DN1452_c0_g4_i1:76-519(+)
MQRSVIFGASLAAVAAGVHLRQHEQAHLTATPDLAAEVAREGRENLQIHETFQSEETKDIKTVAAVKASADLKMLQLGASLHRNATSASGNGTAGREYVGFEDEWHKEWRAGDFPSWKKTATDKFEDDGDLIKFEDAQSDGKPSPAR